MGKLTARRHLKMNAHAGCKNRNDCEGNQCGSGECVDHDKPTDVHMNDHHCDCDCGLEPEEQVFEDGKKYVCGNIPDCPKDVCLPGGCEDLVDDYKCHCDEGSEMPKCTRSKS